MQAFRWYEMKEYMWMPGYQVAWIDGWEMVWCYKDSLISKCCPDIEMSVAITISDYAIQKMMGIKS